MTPDPAPYTRKGWTTLDPVARQLIVVRFSRSIAQGALSVDFTLYLKLRHWTAPEVGLLLMAGGLAGAALSLFVGPASDRIGRRLFLLVYETGLIVGTLAIILHPTVWILVLTAALFGFGRGTNGSSGPFAPAEQAWLAQSISNRRHGSAFSFNAGLQFWGMGLGSLLAAFLPNLLPGVVGPERYVPLFSLNLVIAIINLVQIWILQEKPPARVPRSMAPSEAREETNVVKRENRALGFLAVVNTVNALGVGLIGPLLPYWFNLRFGVGPSAIGSVFAVTFFLTGFFSLAIGTMSGKVGLIRSIVLTRLLGVGLLVAMPFMPSFWIAAVIYIFRTVVTRGSVGARQAFSMGLVRDQRRGFASSLNAATRNIPAAIGPGLGGWLLGMRVLAGPFVIASALQLVYVILFPTLMGPYDHSRNRSGDHDVTNSVL
ncbi:MAG: MFS transporter [Sulfobacillus sp.]